MAEGGDGPQTEGRSAAARFRIRGEALVSGGQLELKEILLSPDEAAEHLGLDDPSWVFQLIREEQLPHIVLDQALLIPQRDLEAWYVRRHHSTVPPPPSVEHQREERERRSATLRRLLAAMRLPRETLVAWGNEALQSTGTPAERSRRSSSSTGAISPHATEKEAVGVIVEAARSWPGALEALCEALERGGVRDRLSAIGHGRALSLLDELERGLPLTRQGPDRLKASQMLELPGVWEELELWLEDLWARQIAQASPGSEQGSRDFDEISSLLDEHAIETPRLLLHRMTLLQLRSFAAWLGPCQGRGKGELIEAIAEELRARHG